MLGVASYILQTANKTWSGLVDNDLFRFEVRSGDTYAADPADKQRAEMKVEGQVLKYSQAYNIEYQFKVEAGSPNTADWVVLGQLHAREDVLDASAGPILALQLEGEKLAVVVRADPNAVGTGDPTGVEIYSASDNIVRDQWYAVKLQVVLNPLGEGTVNVWINGQQVANYSGAVGYNDLLGPYWKMGIYRSAASETMAVDFKGLAITEATHTDGWGGRTFYTQTSGDTIVGTSYNDTLYFGGQTGVTASLAITGAQNTGGQGIRTIQAIENLIGTNKNDTLEGNAGNNLLGGNGGVDTVSYEHATSAVTVNLTLTSSQDTHGAGVDTLRGFENLTGSAYADTLIGNADANVLTGGAGDDLLRGGAGSDTFDGGAGNDTVSFSDADLGVTGSLAQTARQGTGFGAKLFIDVENLTGSGFNDVLTGDANGNTLRGGDGTDTLNGGAGSNSLFGDAGNDLLIFAGGNDKMDGGAGIDTVSFANATSGVNINLALTSAQSAAGGSATLTGIENVIGSSFADTLAGAGSDNTLSGGGGDDLLVAGTTNQILDGGSGSDTVTFANAAEGVSISLSETGAQSTSLGAKTLVSIENITGSELADILFGNQGANVIKGGGGDDTIFVGTGSDVMDGGTGIDTITFDRSSAAVNISLALATAQSTGFGAMTLTNFENLTGSTFDDRLTGNAGDNFINGGAGDDAITGGGGGIDRINGGLGSDTVTFAAMLSGVDISLGRTEAQALSGGSVTLVSIESIIGTNYADTLAIGAGGGSISGGGGNDTLISGSGVQMIDGGAGTDTIIAGTGVQTIDGGAGIDNLSFIQATQGMTFNLAETGAQAVASGSITALNIENLTGSAYNDALYGNSAANVISGGAGDDLLMVGTGNDTLDGGAGADTASFAQASKGVSIYLTIADPQSTGFGSMTLKSIENLTGSAFDDRLSGDAGVNQLVGGAGNDTLDGRGGADVLTGGSGADIFREIGGSGKDIIADFSLSDGDRIEITRNLGFTYSYNNDDTLITFASGDTVTVQHAHLTASDNWFIY